MCGVSAADVRDYVWRTCARLNLPLAWLPDRIAGGRFALEEPPSRPSEWVGDVLRQARVFAQRLEHMASLDRDDVLLVSCSSSWASCMTALQNKHEAEHQSGEQRVDSFLPTLCILKRLHLKARVRHFVLGCPHNPV